MSLYYDAAFILEKSYAGSLKSRIYNSPTIKTAPAQVYALVSETRRWNPELKEVVERSGLLTEKKLTPVLALLLAHDQLLSKRGIMAPSRHHLKMAVTKHKARLSAEFTRLRLRKGFGTLEAFKAFVKARDDAPTEHGKMQEADRGYNDEASMRNQSRVRWVRINTLRTTSEEQLETTFSDFKVVSRLTDVIKAVISSEDTEQLLYVDDHVPNLLAVPRKMDLSGTSAYKEGKLIFQDKASCFPAFLLDVSSVDGDIIDACAAPGNKTSHLASFLQTEATSPFGKRQIWAIERDKARASTLEKMMEWTGANSLVTVRAAKDFTQLDPLNKRLRRVEAILLDPSCSGSGIMDRDDGLSLMLPEKDRHVSVHPLKSGKKPQAKRQPQGATTPSSPNARSWLPSNVGEQKSRLTALATFQLKLLTHAFRFPSARRIVYSTCSVHEIENEQVVVNALKSPEAKEHGWDILRRKNQVAQLRDWSIRGNITAFQNALDDPDRAAKLADACIRCEKGGEQGTIGFFVVGFVRAGTAQTERSSTGTSDRDDSEEEWNGFSDKGEEGS